MSNKSYALDNRAAASDDAQLGQGTATQSKDESNSQGGFLSTNVAAGAINANSGTINLTDGGAYDLARDFVTNYNSTLSELVSKQNDSLASASSTTSSLISGLADKISALVESRNTDGESTRNNTILYIALAVAAVFGLFVWRRTR